MTTQTTIWHITETSWESTIYPSSVSPYTLCDGTPRVDARPETRTMTYNSTKIKYQTLPAEFAFTQRQPCIPDPKTCRMWYYDSNINVTNEDELLQQCGRPTGLYEPCLVGGGPVKLIYWPEESEPENFCPNNATISFQHPIHLRNTSVPTMPATVTALGTTFTSGSVYLSFHTLYASYDGFYDRVGPTFKDTIIPVPSTAMSTHCGGFTEAHGPGTPLNYADLNWPVPASAYNCQARCDQRFVPLSNRSETPPQCKTIWSDVNPNIAIPTMVKDLIPEWSSCSMEGFRIPNFWFDPPIMLTRQDSIALPTTPHAEPTQEPPAPSSGLSSSIPVRTGSPKIPETEVGAHDNTALPSKPRPQDQRPTATAADSRYHDSQQSIPISSSPSDAGESKSPPNSDSGIVATLEPDIGDVPETSAAENHSDGGDPSTTSTFTRSFQYQPETSPLDALSILESALASLSKENPGVPTHASQIGNTGEIPNAAEPTKNPSPGTTSSESPQSEEGPGYPMPSPFTEPTHGGVADSSAIHTKSPASSNLGPKPSDTADGVMSGKYDPVMPTGEAAMPSVIMAPGSGISTLTAPGLTVGTSHVAGSTGVVVIDGQTLAPEDPVATVGSHVISLLSSKLVVLSSSAVETHSQVDATRTSGEITLEAGSLTVTANAIGGSSGAISVGGATLSKEGDSVVLDGGETLRLKSSGVAFVGSNTTTLLGTVTRSDAVLTTTPSALPSVIEWPVESSPSQSQPAESGVGKLALCSVWMAMALLLPTMLWCSYS